VIGRLQFYLVATAAAVAVAAGVFWAGWLQRGAWEREQDVKRELRVRREVDRIETDVQSMDDDGLVGELSDDRGVQPR
jgi:hypothetical protein